MEIPKQCIFSGSTDNLNTSMVITLDSGDKVEVWVSDEYADSATPSKIKQAAVAFLDPKRREILELLARAKELGLDLSALMPKPAPAPSAPCVPLAPAPTPAPAPKPQPRKEVELISSNPKNRIIDGAAADSRSLSAAVSGGVSALGESVSGSGREYTIKSEKDKPSQNLKEGERAEIGRVMGRGGMEIAIPVRRVGKTGETRVAVVDTGGDPALQKRFKQLKAQGDSPNGPPDFIRGGYQVKTVQCGVCRGLGSLPNGKSCPKCGGIGAFDLGS